MIGLNNNLCVFSTDGEKPFINAFHHEFESLTCFNHVRRNIKDNLREMIKEEIQTDFERHFWMQNGINFVGLVDSSSVHILEEKVDISG